MEIELRNPQAVRLAIKLAASAPEHLSWIKLASGGTLYATDGLAMIASRDCHTADRTLFVKPTGKTGGLAPNAEGYTLLVDQDKLVEHRARSKGEFDVEVTEEARFPSVENALPTHLWATPEEMPLFDSIRGSEVARAYGLKRGVWTKGPGSNRVYLKGTAAEDTVILAAIKEVGG